MTREEGRGSQANEKLCDFIGYLSGIVTVVTLRRLRCPGVISDS